MGLIGFVMGFIGCVVRVLLGLSRGLSLICHEGLKVFFMNVLLGLS